MRIALCASTIAAVTVLFVACVSVDTGPGGTSTGSSVDASTTAVSTGDAATGVQGTGCAINQDLGIDLCTSTTTCPSVVIDDSQFPGCGWRVQNGVADMQCDCNGLMCPIGTPTTCAQAAALLGEQTQLIVCQQLSEGRCVQPATPMGGTGAGTPAGSGNQSPNCDQTCASGCQGSASCLQLCGC